MLSSWELIVFYLFKGLTQINESSASAILEMHFFDMKLMSVQGETTETRQRVQALLKEVKMDKNRMLVILLTRLLKRLILKTQESID